MSSFQVICADHPRQLGDAVLQRLLAYIEETPDGVIALPTGKTPTLLIQALHRLRSIPNTKRLRFVQLDEYYPIDPSDEKSFCAYVRKHYLAPLQITSEHALTMEGLIGPTLQAHGIEAVFPDRRADLALLRIEPSTPEQRLQRAALEEAVRFCKLYEQTIADWGGIGFFLGGIGLDGHIAFNRSGSSLDSATRLVDLGSRLAATIGIKTICSSENVQAVLFAAGDAKARVAKEAIEGPVSIAVPASLLRTLKHPTFYLTRAAARALGKKGPSENVVQEVHQTFDASLQIAVQPIDFLYAHPLLAAGQRTWFLRLETDTQELSDAYAKDQSERLQASVHACQLAQPEDLLTLFRTAALAQDAKAKAYCKERLLFQQLGSHSVSALPLSEIKRILLHVEANLFASMGGAKREQALHLPIDASQLTALLLQINPSLLIVPYIAEESAPTPLYHALQALSQALQQQTAHPTIWEVCSPFYPFGAEDGTHWASIDTPHLAQVFGDCADSKIHPLRPSARPFWSELQDRLQQQNNRLFIKESTASQFVQKMETLRLGFE